ncbi:hypothetical protein [Methylobacterium nigriterrae]|uniref:hypothetical protein n=1 Tax=Methylobacterium nigriterrae TaxID=3127512 RepID=UPI0030138B0C
MSEKRPQTWFEMKDLRRRLYAKAAWIPLRVSETKIFEDGAEEIIAIGSTAILNAYRHIGDKLGWHEVGIGHDAGPYAFQDKRYKNAETFLHNERIAIGADLVFVQNVGAGIPNKWHINQDLLIALNLVEEGDYWVRPEEAYTPVIRTQKDTDGNLRSIEIKSEFLADYLAARNMSLRLSCYRERHAVYSDASYITWGDGGYVEESENQKFEARLFEVSADGGPLGSVAVFEIWRTDVDEEEDVPVFGLETDENTAHRTMSYERSGPKAYRVEGAFWRDEWVEPAATSERVRQDDPKEFPSFIIEASGQKETSNNLHSEDIGRYLWFSPNVINTILGMRGSSIGWYTADTGWISFSNNWPTHFGVNSIGLINVYAYDVAKVAQWQQRIWAGQNVTPDGAVSGELLSSQMKSRPARTKAPEGMLIAIMDEIDKAAQDWKGISIFTKHASTADILQKVHRFRSVDRDGLLALAKDIARLTADRIDASAIQKIVSPPKGERWGGIKSLEKLVATLIPASEARSMLTPIVGAYELRLGDAHLPSGKLQDAFAMVDIDPEAIPIEQGRQLIQAVAASLARICEMIRAAPSLTS